MRILLACYHTHALRKALKANGHDVLSADLKPMSPGDASPGEHHQGNVFELINERFDAVLAFPPCTFLLQAQLWRCNRNPSRAVSRDEAVQFVKKLWAWPTNIMSLENPVGWLDTAWQRYTQLVRPSQFGDPYSKEICLWLRGLPPLISTCYHPSPKPIGNHVNGRMSQEEKSAIKSSWDWFPGTSKAIADQWFPAATRT